MSSRPWMPLYVNDFRLDTLDLEAAEIGVYAVMLMLAWRRDDAALPNDMAWLKRSLKSCFASFHGHEFNRIVPKILKRYWTLDGDDKWRNKRLTKERQKADKLSAKQKQNADKRWGNSNENNVIAYPGAMPSQSQSQREERIGDFKKVGERKANGWSPPRHGAQSQKHGTTYLLKGLPGFDEYAENYRTHNNGHDPPLDEYGGHWFRTVGETPLPPPRRQMRRP